jgi:hypothetical protein
MKIHALAPSLALALACTLARAAPESAADTERTLKAATQEMLDAIAPGHAAVWEHWLDAAVIQVDENDVVRSKAEILKELQPLPKGLVGHLKIAEWRLALAGDVAVVTHEDDETLDYFGQMLRSRFRMTDTWHRTPQGWRLLGSQVLAVHQDPPAVTLDPATLCAYAGRYVLTPEISATARCDGDKLVFQREGRPDRVFLPELKDQFFEPGYPRSRRLFQRDVAGAITGFVDRREERDIHWTRAP